MSCCFLYLKSILKKINFFIFLFEINNYFIFLDYSNVLISKIIFKIKTIIILIHFQVKKTFKNN